MFAPPGTPAAIIDRLHAESTTVMESPDMQKRLEDQGGATIRKTPSDFGKLMKAQTEKWMGVVKAVGAMRRDRVLYVLLSCAVPLALVTTPRDTLAQATSTSSGQAYPAKPIRIVVPAVPGGGTDILARLLSPRLTELLGQSILVDNRAGASTNIGTEFVARSVPDGHTVLISTTPHAVNPSLFRKLNFDPINDFTMISQLALTQTVLVVHPSLPVKNVKELVALAKARPGQLTSATSGGTSQFLAVEMLKTMTGIDVLNIPYKGAGQALNDTVAGHVQFQVNTLLAALPFIESGRLRAIAVCGAKRATSLPNVPTVGETIKGFESSGWYALLGPAGMPRDVVSKLHDAFSKALHTPAITRRLAELGVDVVAGSPDELVKLMPREITKWEAVVKASGAKPE
jgi:tripartite-type tricarboxylate transporter receptor subunit TctC